MNAVWQNVSESHEMNLNMLLSVQTYMSGFFQDLSEDCIVL